MRERDDEPGALGELVPDARLQRIQRRRLLRAAALLLLRRSLLAGRSIGRGAGLLACVAGFGLLLDDGRIVVHRTMVKRRFQRTETGQRQNIQAYSPLATEKKIIWARPMMFWYGT